MVTLMTNQLLLECNIIWRIVYSVVIDKKSTHGAERNNYAELSFIATAQQVSDTL